MFKILKDKKYFILLLVIAMFFIGSIMPKKIYAEEPRNIEFTVDVKYDGGTLQGNEFSFKLTPTSYSGSTITVKNNSDGDVTFNVPYTDSDVTWKSVDDSGKQTGYLIYSIEQINESNNKVIYDQNLGYVIVKIEKTDEEIAQTIRFAKPDFVEYDLEGLYAKSPYHATEAELQGQAYAVYSYNDKTLTYFRDDPGKYTNNQIIGMYKYFVINEDDSATITDNRNDIEAVIFKDAIKPSTITFNGYRACKYFDLSKLDTSRMTTMNNMFMYCTSIDTINLSTFDTSNVTNMSSMFESSENLKNVILGEFDSSKVETFANMFNKTAIEQIAFSAIENDSVTTAFCSFPHTVKIIDLSTWNRKNDEYDTSTMIFGNSPIYGYLTTQCQYVDITTFVKGYSTDLRVSPNTKVVKIGEIDKIKNGLLDGDYGTPRINVETADPIDHFYGMENTEPSTYVTMSDESMTFNNSVKASVSIKKTDENGNTVSGARLGLEMGNGLLTTWVSGDSPKVFSNLKWGETYTIVELETPDGYIKAEPITFTVTEEGKVMYNNQETSTITMKNKLNTITVRKLWDDKGIEQDRPQNTLVSLYYKDSAYGTSEAFNSSNKLKTLTVSENSSYVTKINDYTWDINFKGIPRYDHSGVEYSYMVKETVPEGYKATISYYYNYDFFNDFSTQDEAHPAYGYNLIIKNTPTRIKVTKVWGDEGNEEYRPDSISFDLYDYSDQDTVVETLTLNKSDYDASSKTWVGFFNHERSDFENFIVKERPVTNYKGGLRSYEYQRALNISYKTDDKIMIITSSGYYIMLNGDGTGNTISKKIYTEYVTQFYVIAPEGSSFTMSFNDDTTDSLRMTYASKTQIKTIVDELEFNKDNVREYYGTGTLTSGTEEVYVYTLCKPGLSEYRNSTIFMNSFELTSVPFTKVWDEEEGSKRPSEVTFDLYNANDMQNPVRTITLKAEDFDDNAEEWNGTFERLAKYGEDNELINYVIVERKAKGYIQKYTTKELDEGKYLKLEIHTESAKPVLVYWYKDEEHTSIAYKRFNATTGTNNTCTVPTRDFYIALADGDLFKITNVYVVDSDSGSTNGTIDFLNQFFETNGIDETKVKEYTYDIANFTSDSNNIYHFKVIKSDTPYPGANVITNTFDPNEQDEEEENEEQEENKENNSSSDNKEKQEESKEDSKQKDNKSSSVDTSDKITSKFIMLIVASITYVIARSRNKSLRRRNKYTRRHSR